MSLGLVAAGLACAVPDAALSQPLDLPPWARQARGLVTVTGDADLDGGGSFSSARWFVDGGVVRMTSPRRSLGVTVGIGQSLYDFSERGLSADIDINELTLAAPLRFAAGNAASVFAVPSLQYAGEAGVDAADGLTYGLLAGLSWRVSPGFSIGPGFGAFSAHDGDVEAFPILVIDWDITDRLSLSTGSGLAATRGPGLSLTYAATRAWSVGITARSETFEFRLDDADAAFPDAVGIDRSVPVVVSASYAPNPALRLTAFAGAATGGEVEFQDEDGNRLAREDYDPAALFGVAFTLRF